MTNETKEIYAKLQRVFPASAYKEIDDGKGLTSIKAQFFIERLNDVLGPDCWHAVYDITTDNDELVVIKCQLNISHEHLSTSRQSYGSFAKSVYVKWKKKEVDIVDRHKKAMTDSLKKACSHLGLGAETFKGNINPDGSFKTSSSQDRYLKRMDALSKPSENKAEPKEEPPAKKVADPINEKQLEVLNYARSMGFDQEKVNISIGQYYPGKDIFTLGMNELEVILNKLKEKNNGGS